MRAYLVCATPRSGSTLLCFSLPCRLASTTLLGLTTTLPERYLWSTRHLLCFLGFGAGQCISGGAS